MRFRKRGGIWHVRMTVGDARHERSTGLSDRRAAEARAREIERELADPTTARRQARESTTLQEAVDLATQRYERDATTGRRSTATAEFYTRKWAQLTRVLGPTTRISDLDVAVVTKYVEARRTEGVTDHTIIKEVTALRVALRYCRDAGLWGGSLESLVPADLSTDYVPKTRALELHEVQKLVSCLTPKRAAWVGLMVGSGAEQAAALRAEVGDYDPKAGLVRVRGSKTINRDRTVPVVLPACRALLDLAWGTAPPKGEGLLLRPWGMIWRDIQAACVRAKIEPCSAHDLRRTFAHWHISAGLAYEDVARAMGHSSTTMIYRVYGRVTPEALRARMVAGLAPLVPHGGEKTPLPPRGSKGGASRKPLEKQCRRSDLNQRPWDYDSPALTTDSPLFSPWSGDGRSTWRDASAPPVPHEGDDEDGEDEGEDDEG